MYSNRNFSVILFTLFFSAITYIFAKDLDTYVDNSNPANVSKIEIAILSDLLKEQQYKKLDFDDFRQRCLDYFGIDIQQVQKINGYFQCIEGVSGCYNIALDQQFLSTFGESIFYDPSKPKTPTIQQVKASIRHKDNMLAQQFIAYNKLLFNDDTSVNSFFIDNEFSDYVLEVVFRFDYGKNEVLYNATLPYIKTVKVDFFDNPHLLFYNNPQKGYKKRLLNDLYLQKGIAAIKETVDSTYNNWEKFSTDLSRINNGSLEKASIDQSVQDQALLHLIKLVSHHQSAENSLEESEQLAYSYINKFFNKDNKLEERLKQHNYYDMGLTILPEEKRVISKTQNQLLENNYVTQSKDGYVNFRKEPNIKSEVVKKLPNKIHLIKIKADGNWYYTQLADDNNMRGYIHISQLMYSK